MDYLPRKLPIAAEHGEVYLSKREGLCLSYLAQGYSQAEISTALGLSKRTVETYINNIKNKTNAQSRSELVACSSQILAYLPSHPQGR